MSETSMIYNEAGVKNRVKKILSSAGVYYFMPPANGFGATGITDFIAVINGQFVGIETKFGTRKMTANQEAFKERILLAGGLHFLVSDRNLDEFAVAIQEIAG